MKPRELAWAAAIAVSPGWVGYTLTRPNPQAFVRGNAPASIDLGVAALCLLASAAVVAGLWWLLRGRDPIRRTRALVLLPVLVALYFDGAGFLGMRRPVLILASAALIAWVAPRIPKRVLASMRRYAVPLLAVAIVGTAAFLIRLALLRHFGLHTRAFDLGIYDNTVFTTLHGDFLGCSLIRSGTHTAAHFDPILAIVALPYAIAPRAETLIVIQALWVLSSAVPAYRIAHRKLGDRASALVVALCLLAYPSVHGVILYEFHSLTLLAPAALWLVEFLDAARPRLYLGALAIVLLVREDAALFAIGVGVYAVLATEHRRLGALTIAIAATYLVAVKTLAMPDAALLMEHSDEAYAYANRYRGFIPEGGGAGDALATFVTNPAYVLGHVLSREKVMAMIAFVLPLGFLPLLAGRRLLLIAYGVAFMFLATHNSLYFPMFHYSSVLYPMLFAALPAGMLRAQALLEARGDAPDLARRRVHGWLITCATLGTLTMGAVLPNAPFKLHTPIPRSLRPAAAEQIAWLRRAVTQIPPDATVSGTNRTTPHVSNRVGTRLVQQQIETDYLLIHDEDLAPAEKAWLRARGRAYEPVDEHGPLRLLRRR